jgi:hypothetical protein
MSERLLISIKSLIKEDDDFYDCIYTEESTWEDLLFEWCGFDATTGMYFGPWKICIRSQELLDQFAEDFKKLGKMITPLQSFDDVWAIYDDLGNTLHISQKENKKYMAIMDQIKDLP